MPADTSPLPFETFTHFERLPEAGPLFHCEPPEWAAAAHAIVVDDTVHYLWGRRRVGNSWVIMHSFAPASDPAAVEHDSRNPVVVPSEQGFDEWTVEYPFPFRNPADGRYYAYYLGKRKTLPKQTGLLVGDGDFGRWTRVCAEPVIAAETAFETQGASHPSVAVDGDTLHITYTGESERPPVLCHATAPASDPAAVTKDPANPVFTGSGEWWDSRGVREVELLKDGPFFHLFYGGYDGKTWRLGHVRTRDFHTFEPNPGNPILTPSADPEAWDCDGLLTPQVFAANGTYYLLYAGLKDQEWQSGLAVARGTGIASVSTAPERHSEGEYAKRPCRTQLSESRRIHRSRCCSRSRSSTSISKSPVVGDMYLQHSFFPDMYPAHPRTNVGGTSHKKGRWRHISPTTAFSKE